jgi:phosphoribosylformimino-5-aminoimidazole carboxamide ribotide isomerase
MRFLPAIDMLDGQAVRLSQGDYAKATHFGAAMEAVERLLAQGIDALHLVDLNAARDPDDRSNLTTLSQCVSLAREHNVMVELGGGIRDLRMVFDLLALGVDRVIVGTSALEADSWVRGVDADLRSKLVVSLDFRTSEGESFVVVDAWRRTSAILLEDAVDDFAQAGFINQLITPVARDGMASGPDLELYRRLVSLYPVALIASGGVRDANDLADLAAIAAGVGYIEGAIVGTAIYSGSLSVAEGLQACSR